MFVNPAPSGCGKTRLGVEHLKRDETFKPGWKVQGRKGLVNTFSAEFGGFCLEKVGEFRLNPGSRTKFANLPVFAMR